MFKGPQFDQSVILLRAGHCRRPHDHSPLNPPLRPATAGAFHPSQAWRDGRSAASGCTFAAPSTVSPTQSNSGSVSNVTCRCPSGFSEKALARHGCASSKPLQQSPLSLPHYSSAAWSLTGHSGAASGASPSQRWRGISITRARERTTKGHLCSLRAAADRRRCPSPRRR